MSKKMFLAHTGTPQNFDFDPHGSGRYRQGSGENPHQHGFDILYEIDKMRKSGMTEKEVAVALGYKSSGELRAIKSNLIAEKYAYDAARAIKMRERGMSFVAIGNKLGYSDKKIAKMVEEPQKMKDQILESTVNILKESLEKNKYIDVGEGVERMLGIPRTKLDAAIMKLKMEGQYEVKNMQVQQINAPIGQKTSLLVIAPKDTPTKDIYQHLDDIHLVTEYHSNDFGKTYIGFEKPVSVDSSRIQIAYADKDGFQPKDGIIEIRPGVEDLTLGQARYAQVRISVDDKYYLKGMALYSNDLPKGVDIRFNSNKMEGEPLEKVLKPQKVSITTKELSKELGIPENKIIEQMKSGKIHVENVNDLDKLGVKDSKKYIDKTNPFGAMIKANISETAGGQTHYIDKNGVKKLSAVNKVNEEGDWGEWDKTLASQFLSKQSNELAKSQLNYTYLKKKAELEDIRSITNSEIRKKMLYAFADDCDSSAVDLKAASMPRQATQVLLPLNSMSEKEVYAPNFRNTDTVCLLRYPHSGPTEILQLKVNNKNKEAKALFGEHPKDCVVINPKNARKLSGADFDGDTVVVIPNNRGLINVKNILKELEDYDPHIQYKGYEGMKVMKEKNKGTEMGKITNLITDMTMIGCTDSELTRAIKFQQVVIDAPKHKLDWKRAYKEQNIAELKKKYQGGGGAGTIISRAKSQERVPVRKLYTKIDPETGKKIYTEDTRNATYTKSWTLKDGTVRTKDIPRTYKSTKMAETDDAFKITSDPSSPYPMEVIYATYANRMKQMGNEVRLEALKIKSYSVNESAKKSYSKEIESLNKKLNNAKMNAPYERQCQMAAGVVLKQKKISNPEMSDSEKKKIGQMALNNARARIIPGGRKQRIVLTEKELEAINNNAIPVSHLKDILNNVDNDKLTEMVMPKKTIKGISNARIAQAKALIARGETQADVADVLGISVTTLRKYLNQ